MTWPSEGILKIALFHLVIKPHGGAGSAPYWGLGCAAKDSALVRLRLRAPGSIQRCLRLEKIKVLAWHEENGLVK